MDDVDTFHTRSYDKAKEIRPPSPLQRTIILLKLLPSFTVKLLIVAVFAIYSMMLPIVQFFVPKKLIDIRGHLAVVTGGSNGIGRSICLELARNGCNVACLDVDLSAAQQLCAELKVLGVKASGYQVDVTDYDALERVKKEINDEMGVVDILVNNAGLMPQNSFRDGDFRKVQRVIDVNVSSHFWTTRIFIDDMIKRRYGYIVGVSSMIAFYPMSTSVTYTTSKYAVKGFMDALHQDCRHENWGVKTLTVFPHLCNTRQEIVDYLRKKVGPTTLQRVGILSPDEVGKETVFALRRGSRYVTVPRYYLWIGKIFQSLLCEVQDLVDDLLMPSVTSHTNYTASASENGHKKSQ